MKPFVYSLQFLVEANRRSERDLQLELARLRQACEDEAETERQIMVRIEQVHLDWQESLAAGSGGRILMHYSQIFSLLRRELADQQRAVQAAELQVIQCLAKLHEVLRDLESLDTLRHQQEEQHRLAEQQEKAREMDEFVAFHHQKGKPA
jgi:flagellar export protein FliJ